MSNWPEGWTNDGGDQSRRRGGGRGPDPEIARSMPHVRREPTGNGPGGGGYPGGAPRHEPPLPPDLSPRGAVPPQQQPPGYDGAHGGDGYDDGYNTGQVYGAGRGPVTSGPGDPGGPGSGEGGPPYGGPSGPPATRPNWRKRITIGVIGVFALLLIVSIGTYFWADAKLKRDVDLGKVEDRPGGGDGTNYLIVGSDSREGMSAKEKKDLHTGSADGKRTDSMMILHVGDNGNTMISLPRDSWVTIPAFTGSESGHRIQPQQQKLNAAFSIQGPELLVRTIEYNTGLKIDHYAEIGFGGFAKIVDAVGGVEMNIPRDIKDKNSGADLKKGKQTLDGKEALAFVRNRYEAGSDLERTKNQQKFLSTLASQAATPSTILNPFRLYPTMSSGLDTLIVDKDMSLWKLRSMFWAMKGVTGGDGKQMNMPVANPGYSTPKGSAVLWDMPKVKKLMEELKNDDKVTVSAQ
ncbi:LCP family protein [Streptomyces zagrosensis]|uniref:LCP family protein required for cell wall assembly n=1 Tax=Streptomyces zagrosensis TaxID=1042984 RepID=A0A7W9QF38_9ACTN|nr:LCP family protein [Streptomyces zagrosensis]MBB5939098.1 LCP family protein required for cell wall assembly [Streptomyces zagrosensis]